MQQIEIVFFAALAVFLGWKLYAALGRRSDGENRRPGRPDYRDPAAPAELPGPQSASGSASKSAPRPANDAKPALSLPARDRRRLEADLAAATPALRDGLAAIGRVDPAFDPAQFLTGAKRAFEMVLTAFAAADQSTLSQLLAPAIADRFAAAIRERQKKGEIMKTSLIGILEAQPIEAELVGRTARLTIKFVSQQIGVTEDDQGRILSGDPKEVSTIVDLFTFARDIDSGNPNWQIVATASPN